MAVTEEVANYVAALKYKDIPPEVIGLARSFILDGLGVALAGSTDGQSLVGQRRSQSAAAEVVEMMKRVRLHVGDELESALARPDQAARRKTDRRAP